MGDPETGLSSSWFALAVRPRFDKAVAKALDRKGFETFVPLYRKPHPNRRRGADAELPLFPGYVCCRFDVQKRMPILTTPGVIQVLGAGNTPVALAEQEIVALQRAIQAQLPLRPFPFIEVGQRVKIERGVLTGVEGIVMSCKETLRLVLSISLLQRSVLVEINRDQVALAGAAGAVFDPAKGEYT